MEETTVTASTSGTTPLTNSVIDAVTPTDTVVPKLESIAPVTTADGLCAGFDLVYEGTVDVDVYDTGAGATVGTTTALLDQVAIKFVKEMYSSKDTTDSGVLAFKLIVE